MKSTASLLIFVLPILFAPNVYALEYPASCRTPSGVVEEIFELDTEKASMRGRHTLPDIVYACTAGFVRQGTMDIEECIRFYESENVYEQALFTEANCAKGAITVDGNLTVFPIAPNCANGGFQAIEAFKLLCPSSGLMLSTEN